MDERSEEQKAYPDEQGDVCDVVRENAHVDKVDHGTVEPSVTTQDPVENVAKRSTEHQSKGDGLDPSGCVAQNDHDRDDDTDRDDGNNRALARENRETGAGVKRDPELEHSRYDPNRPIRERVDGPCFGQLIRRRNNDANDNRKLSVAQPRRAASTVVVAYGIASNLATGIGSPVTSHIPYKPFSIRS